MPANFTPSLKPLKCIKCGRTPQSSPPARFATLAESGQHDPFCIACRFDHIDNKHSSPIDIREDMRAAGMPVRRRPGNARTLRFGAGADDNDVEQLPDTE